MGNNLQKENVQGYNIAYRRSGSGEPVLLIHGITTYSFIWEELFARMSDKFDLIAVDLLGCGDSDKPLEEDYSIINQADIISEFCDNLGLERFHLVGHDVGGGISQILAVKYPQKLIDLALLNSVAYDFWPVQPIVAMRTPIIRQLAMATLDLGTFKLIIKRALYDKEKLTDELMQKFWKTMNNRTDRKAFLHFARCLESNHLVAIADDLHQIKTPLLIVRGEDDIYLSKSISDTLHKNIRGSRKVSLKECGHFCQIDQPQRIADTLIGFFNER